MHPGACLPWCKQRLCACALGPVVPNAARGSARSLPRCSPRQAATSAAQMRWRWSLRPFETRSKLRQQHDGARKTAGCNAKCSWTCVHRTHLRRAQHDSCLFVRQIFLGDCLGEVKVFVVETCRGIHDDAWEVDNLHFECLV